MERLSNRPAWLIVNDAAEWITAAQFAKIAGVGARTIRKSATAGRLKAYADNSHGVLLIDRKALHVFYGDGTEGNPDGTQAEPEGTQAEPEGTETELMRNPEGTGRNFEGTARNSEGTQTEPGSGTVRNSDGTLTEPGGTLEAVIASQLETIDTLKKQILTQSELIARLQDELAEERQHSRSITEQLAKLANQAQQLQLLEMQPERKPTLLQRLFGRKKEGENNGNV